MQNSKLYLHKNDTLKGSLCPWCYLLKICFLSIQACWERLHVLYTFECSICIFWLNNIFECLSSHVWNECWACSVQPLWSNEIPTVQNSITMLSWCAWNKYRQFYDNWIPSECLCPSPDLHMKAPKHLRMTQYNLVCLMFYITNELKLVWQQTECWNDTHSNTLPVKTTPTHITSVHRMTPIIHYTTGDALYL